MDEKNEFLTSLYNSLNYYGQISSTFCELQNSHNDLQQVMQRGSKRSIPVLLVLAISILCISLIIVIPTWGYDGIREFLTFLPKSSDWLIVVGLVISIILAISISYCWTNANKKRYNKAVDFYGSRINQLEEVIFNHYVNFCDSEYQVIPYVYCNPEIIRQFMFYIQSCRADSLKEAVNCYISDINTAMAHHYQMLTLSAAQQSVIEARKGKQAATVAAVASILANF